MNWLTCRGSKGEEKVLVLTGVNMEVSDGSPTLQCPAVLCCRCSPSHKAQIVNLIKSCTKRLTWGVGETWAVGETWGVGETWALKSAHSAVVAYHATFVFS